MNRTLVKTLLVVIASVPAHAGPLSPPNGPVTSTGITIEQAEPRTPLINQDGQFVISQPGSYYLVENLNSEADESALVVTSGGVTIDLNGFVITYDDSPSPAPGIDISANSDVPVVIRNGTIRDFTGAPGVRVGADALARIEGVSVTNCAIGFECSGTTTLTDCYAVGNAGYGFSSTSLFVKTIVTRCVAQTNGDDGFHLGRTVITDSLGERNAGDGIWTGPYATVTRCIADDNGGHGILCGGTSTLSHCKSVQSGQIGFALGTSSTVEHCVARFSGQMGFRLLGESVVTFCAATQNTEKGFLIEVSDNTLITNCVADSNGVSGGFAGIECDSNAVVDANVVTDNGRGIRASAGSFVVRNRASGNSVANYDLGTASAGPISSDPSTATSPWANFEF